MIPVVILKTFVETDDNKLDICDTVEHEGDFWLVPEWIVPPDAEWKSPARMIRVTGLLQQVTGLNPPVDYQLYKPIKRAVLDGLEDSNWTVLEEPGHKFVAQTEH